MRVRRSHLLLALVALAAAACGGAADAGERRVELAPGEIPDAAVVIDSTPPTSTAESVAIPNITLTLADGATFDLAEVDTPVMMIFWAEW